MKFILLRTTCASTVMYMVNRFNPPRSAWHTAIQWKSLLAWRSEFWNPYLNNLVVFPLGSLASLYMWRRLVTKVGTTKNLPRLQRVISITFPDWAFLHPARAVCSGRLYVKCQNTSCFGWVFQVYSPYSAQLSCYSFVIHDFSRKNKRIWSFPANGVFSLYSA